MSIPCRWGWGAEVEGLGAEVECLGFAFACIPRSLRLQAARVLV